MPEISVIIPTRNEADNVRPLLERLTAVANQIPLEVIFVDDSTDQTPQQIEQSQVAFSFPIRLHHRVEGQRNGLSGAVVEGIRMAQGVWVGVMDADLQHPPEMMGKMYQHAQNTGADIVVGSRAADFKGPKGLSLGRTLTSQALTILARTVFPRILKNSSDPLTGLFLVRRQSVRVDHLRPDGFKILMEILIRCPELHVSEIFFDFAERHHGKSKADFNEGIRFFRHLLRLRLTSDGQVTRAAISALFVLMLDHLVLLGLCQSTAVSPFIKAVMALEVTLFVLFVLLETWVFQWRSWKNGRFRRLFDFYLSTHLVLAIVWLPFMWWATARANLPLLTLNLVSLLLSGGVRYLFSEQWIWTRGLIAGYQEPFYYDIHNIVGIESAVHIPDLSYFRTVEPPAHIDIRILVDRHGTPSRNEGSISFDEGLGRFGFGLSIMPGEATTETVVSPQLQKSPFVLFKNVLEPLLRWVLVRKGYALVYGGGVAKDGRAVLIISSPEVYKVETLLQILNQTEWEFMADDGIIVGRDGSVLSFPRMVPIFKQSVNKADREQLTAGEHYRLFFKRFIYDRRIRQFGHWLRRIGLPIATLNMALQRFTPPAKFMMHRLVPEVSYLDKAQLAKVVRLRYGSPQINSIAHAELLAILIEHGRQEFGYPPYTYMVEALSQWRGEDLTAVEEAIIKEATRRCDAFEIQRDDDAFWQQIIAHNQDATLPLASLSTIKNTSG